MLELFAPVFEDTETQGGEEEEGSAAWFNSCQLP